MKEDNSAPLIAFSSLFAIFRDNQKRGVGNMTLKQDITIVKNCNTSAQMFNVAESLSHQISDLEDRLKDAEYDYNWTLSRAVSSRLQ